MPKLKDFITERATEIEKALEPLRDQLLETQRRIYAYERELADLRNAAKAIGIVNRIERPLGVTRRTAPSPTIKEAVLQILDDFPEGLIALDILAKINDRFSIRLVRTSLSPQLSRLKQEGKIVNHGSTWLKKAKKNEGPST
jgi:hypothetical protein